jgi:hypothetical protein
VVLGLPWLQRENPQINWAPGNVYLTTREAPAALDTAAPLHSSFFIPISIPKTYNNSLSALRDSSASDNFIDSSLVSEVHTQELEHPVFITHFDGTPAGFHPITHYLDTSFHVIFGIPWLQETNPLVKWTAMTLSS